MNISFPDNANISIIVNASGLDAPTIGSLDGAPRILLSPAAPAPKAASSRRGVLFLGAAALMCVAVLSVVHFQRPSGMPQVDPAHAERLPSPAELQYPTVAPYTAPLQRTPPSEQARVDANAEATVRRLLEQAPTITPPPGAPVVLRSPQPHLRPLPAIPRPSPASPTRSA